MRVSLSARNHGPLCAHQLGPRGSTTRLRRHGQSPWGGGHQAFLPGSILRILQRRSLPAALILHRSHGATQRRQLSRFGRRSGLAVQAVYGWPVDGPLKAFIELRSKLRPLATALRVLWEAQRRWLSHTLARTALWVGLLVGVATAAANLWGVPAINQRLLPLATQQAAVMLQREVAVERVRWLAPPGLTGFMPLASVGPVSVGPGPVERSSATAEEVLVGIDPLRSAMQRELVLTFTAKKPEVTLVEGDNFSWFGYPEDTVPSARNFLSGLGSSSDSAPPAGGGASSSSTNPGSGAGGASVGKRRGTNNPGGAGASSSTASGSSSSRGQGLPGSQPAGGSSVVAAAGSSDNLQGGSPTAEATREGDSAVSHVASRRTKFAGPASISQAAGGSMYSGSGMSTQQLDHRPQQEQQPRSERSPAAQASQQKTEGSSFLERIAQLLVQYAEEAQQQQSYQAAPCVALEGIHGTAESHAVPAGALPAWELAMSSDSQSSGQAHSSGASSSNWRPSGTLGTSYTANTGAGPTTTSSAPGGTSATGSAYSSPSSSQGRVEGGPLAKEAGACTGGSFAEGSLGRSSKPRPSQRHHQGSAVGGLGTGSSSSTRSREASSIKLEGSLGTRDAWQPGALHRSLAALGAPAGAAPRLPKQAAPPTAWHSMPSMPQQHERHASESHGLGAPASDGVVFSSPAILSRSVGPSRADCGWEGMQGQQRGHGAAGVGHDAQREEHAQQVDHDADLLPHIKARRHRRSIRLPDRQRHSRVLPGTAAAHSLDATPPLVERQTSSLLPAAAAEGTGELAPQAEGAFVLQALPQLHQQLGEHEQHALQNTQPQLGTTADDTNAAFGAAADAVTEGGSRQVAKQVSPAARLNQARKPLGSQTVPGLGSRIYSLRAGLRSPSWLDFAPVGQAGGAGSSSEVGSSRIMAPVGPSDAPVAVAAPQPAMDGSQHAAAQPTGASAAEEAAKAGAIPAATATAGEASGDSIHLITPSQAAREVNSLPALAFNLPYRPLQAPGGTLSLPGNASAQQATMQHKAPAAAQRLLVLSQSATRDEAAGVGEGTGAHAPSEEAAAWQALPQARQRAMARRLASLPRLEAASLLPAAEVDRRTAFSAHVSDPALLNRKGGSAALNLRGRRSAPASHLLGPRPYMAGAARAQAPLASASTSAGLLAQPAHGAATQFELSPCGQETLEGPLFGAINSGTGSDAEAYPGAATSLPAGEERVAAGTEESSLSAGGALKRRLNLGPRVSRPGYAHPGYFTPAEGPKYTPAGPDALADRRARQQQALGDLLKAAGQAVLDRLDAPAVAVGQVRAEAGTLIAHIAGEATPRRFESVNVTAVLGAKYDTLSAQLTCTAHERHPDSRKFTILSPHANTNLRHVTGRAALQAWEAQAQQPSQAPSPMPSGQGATRSASSAGAADAFAAGPDGAAPASPIAGNGSSNSSSGGGLYSGRPTGGTLKVSVQLSGLSHGFDPRRGILPLMEVAIGGHDLHAPLVERTIELPMDIHEGRIDGELVMKCYNAKSWHFPEFHGRLAVRGAEFHFWDSPDDIAANVDLLFEKDRLYLHNASGRFGSIPLTLTGDLDLEPATGSYRLSAIVPGVEVNQLRASLGVRPMPLPVAGAVSGTLHITGPLEKPVFSGTVQTARPTPEMLADCEPTQALDVLASEPAAVAAYDKLPVQSAGAVFTLDMSKETLVLHSMHAEPVDGGQLFGSGRMVVAPWAESYEGAVSIKAEGVDLPAEELALRYLPAGTRLPPSLVLGKANLTATMRGSHMSPTLDVAFQLPDAPASGSVQLTREATRASLVSPTADASATLYLDPPSFQQVKAAVTQAQAMQLSQPNPTGCDAEVVLRGVDVVPLTSDEQALRQLQQSGQPLRLRVNGRARISGSISPNAAVPAGQATTQGRPAMAGGTAGGWAFDGNLGLEGVRLNQLQVFRKLSGTLQASEQGVNIHAKGDRADEVLSLDLALPLLPTSSEVPSVQQAVALGIQPANRLQQTSAHPLAGPAVSPVTAGPGRPGTTTTAATLASPSPLMGRLPAGAVEGGPPSWDVEHDQAAQAQVPAGAAGLPQQRGGGELVLRGGQLMVAGNVDATGSQLDLKVQNLRLDELELASLRGDVQEVSCSLNFESQTGRGKAHLVRPRYSGLMGESLSGGFRWERDVVRLERVVVQQEKSRYEVQGEYAVPPNMRLPTSAAELAWQQAQQGGAAAVPAGRWRVQVIVPGAELQEIIPAARLLQTATSLTPVEYERAKQAFLSAVKATKIEAQELKSQLLASVEHAVEATPAAAGSAAGDRSAPPGASGGLSTSASSMGDTRSSAGQAKGAAGAGRVAGGGIASGAPLPGLQDLRGQWSGTVQAYGGGTGPASLEFDMRGAGWQWGPHYGLDTLTASGSYHSEEGLQLQEVVLKSGDAKLTCRGSLLGEKQDATLLLNDFPMATLRPLFRAMPALEHAAPAVTSRPTKLGPSPRPLGVMTNVLGRASNGLGLAPGAATSDSPINGLLYLSGKLGGSRDAPTGEVAVRLYDAAIGSTRLAQAQGSARLNDQLQLTFSVEMSPADGHRSSGHLRAEGRVPLAPLQQHLQTPGADVSTSSSSSAGNAAGAALAAETAPAAATAPGVGSSALASAGGGGSTALARRDQPLDVRVDVRDGGMAILTSVTPDLQWQHGNADVAFRMTGPLDAPHVTGRASLSKATLDCPLLKYPVTGLGGEVRLAGGALTVDGLEARVGRRGHIKVRGGLPMSAEQQAQQQLQQGTSQQPAPLAPSKLTAEVQGLELRLRNIYTGQLDASLALSNSLAQPTVAGNMKFSQGTLFLLQPAGASGEGTTALTAAAGAPKRPTGAKAAAAPGATAGPAGMSAQGQRWGDGPVARAFEAFTRREPDIAEQINAMMQQEVEELEHMAEEAQHHQVALDKLAIQLGPDLRATVPLVMNFSVTGTLEVSGPAHPDQVQVSGRLRLPSGDVNLVATQLTLDREHANQVVFQAPAGSEAGPGQGGSAAAARGVDPLVDIVLTGGDLRLSIQGRASEWQDHVVLQYLGGRQGAGAGAATGGSAGADGQLDADEAARILEDKLKAALLADNGQLALARLAGTTVSSLMPKIETQGQLGTTRFRLVSSPTLPGLLSLDPSLADPSQLLNSLMMGTQGEIQFGPRLQAVMVRKMGESDVNTQWTLNYNLSSRLRMQFSVTSAPPYPKTLMFQYSSEGNT